MAIRRRALTFGAAAVLISSTALFAQNAAPRKLNDAEKKEIQAAIKLADDVSAGQPAPNDVLLAWDRVEFLKAPGNKEYVPFTVTVDPAKIAGGKFSLYWRVVSTDPKPVAAPVAVDPKAKKDDKKPAVVEYAWQDLNMVAVPSGQAGPMRVSRSFMVEAGNYDVIVVAKEPTPEKPKKGDPAPKVAVARQTVSVPDLWNGELSTSTLFERIDPLPAALTPQQQGERPYALGTMELVPVLSTKLNKESNLSTFLFIYNAKTDSANKPDLSVEYSFYVKQAGAEKFFNKTSPQNLNAQTLPPGFDFAAGHQLQTGQAVPLASFPEGDYRLEIKILDKLADKSLTRDVNFSISGS